MVEDGWYSARTTIKIVCDGREAVKRNDEGSRLSTPQRFGSHRRTMLRFEQRTPTSFLA
jgi:hypothetical protein